MKNRKDFLRRVEILCGIVKHEIVMRNVTDVDISLKYISNILDKVEGTETWKDVKIIVRYKMLDILSEIDENYSHWEIINEIFERVN